MLPVSLIYVLFALLAFASGQSKFVYVQNQHFSSDFGVGCGDIDSGGGAGDGDDGGGGGGGGGGDDGSHVGFDSVCGKFLGEPQTNVDVIRKAEERYKIVGGVCHCKCPDHRNTSFNAISGICESNIRYVDDTEMPPRFGVGCSGFDGTSPFYSKIKACAKYDGIPYTGHNLDPDIEGDACHCQCHSAGKTTFDEKTQKCRGIVKEIYRHGRMDFFHIACPNGSDERIVEKSCRSFFGHKETAHWDLPKDHADGEPKKPKPKPKDQTTCGCHCNGYIRQSFNSELQTCVDVIGPMENLCQDVTVNIKMLSNSYMPILHQFLTLSDQILIALINKTAFKPEIHTLHDDKWLPVSCFNVTSAVSFVPDTTWSFPVPVWNYDPKMHRLRGKIIRVRMAKRDFVPLIKLNNGKYCDHFFKIWGEERPLEYPPCLQTTSPTNSLWYYVLGGLIVLLCAAVGIVAKLAASFHSARKQCREGKNKAALFDRALPKFDDVTESSEMTAMTNVAYGRADPRGDANGSDAVFVTSPSSYSLMNLGATPLASSPRLTASSSGSRPGSGISRSGSPPCSRPSHCVAPRCSCSIQSMGAEIHSLPEVPEDSRIVATVVTNSALMQQRQRHFEMKQSALRLPWNDLENCQGAVNPAFEDDDDGDDENHIYEEIQ